MNTTELQIESILCQMSRIWRTAIGPRRRRDYMREKGVSGIDWRFSLNPDNIIEQHIPSRVAGSVGIAKVFCKFAHDAGLDCSVMCVPDYQDWIAAHDGEENIIHGRALIVIEVDGCARVLNPGRNHLSFLDCNVVSVGRMINLPGPYMPCPITAIIPRDEFISVDTYQKLRNLYVSGDIKKSEFLLQPDKFVIEYPRRNVGLSKRKRRQKQRQQI